MSKSIVVGDYTISGVLGSGSFATVYRAVNRITGENVAIKAVSIRKLDKKALANLESEISILQGINHPNVVRLLDVQKSDKFFYLVFEFCAGGDLSRLIQSKGPFPEDKCRKMMQQLAKGLEFMWMKHLIHRDLKPQNILMSDDSPDAVLKIADFGFARHLEAASLADTLCGSPLYMAPEILRYQRYDAKADLWSVGAILFELLTKRPPFTGANHLELLANIERRDAVLPADIIVSRECKTFLDCLLRRNPHMRMSFQEFFSSPFLHPPRPVLTESVFMSTEVASGRPQPMRSSIPDISGAMAAVGAHLKASGHSTAPPPPPLKSGDNVSGAGGVSLPSLPPTPTVDNASVGRSFGSAPPPPPLGPLPPVTDIHAHAVVAAVMSPPRGLAVFGVEGGDTGGPQEESHNPHMITLSTRLPSMPPEGLLSPDDESPGGFCHSPPMTQSASSDPGFHSARPLPSPPPPMSPVPVLAPRATPHRSPTSGTDNNSAPSTAGIRPVVSPPRLQRLNKPFQFETGDPSSPASVLRALADTVTFCRSAGENATTIVTLATCYCQYYKLHHGLAFSFGPGSRDETWFGLTAPDARHMLKTVVQELLFEGSACESGNDSEAMPAVTQSEILGSARVAATGFVDADVVAAYTTPLDANQIRAIDFANACALSLYLKSCQVLEMGLRGASTALMSPHLTSLRSASTSSPELCARLDKSAHYLAEVQEWLLACMKRCMAQCDACFSRLPPDDSLPSVSATDVLLRSATVLARLGLGKDALVNSDVSVTTPSQLSSECRGTFAQAGCLFALLPSCCPELSPTEARTLRQLNGMIDSRVCEQDSPAQPSPFVVVS